MHASGTSAPALSINGNYIVYKQTVTNTELNGVIDQLTYQQQCSCAFLLQLPVSMHVLLVYSLTNVESINGVFL